MMRRGCDRMPGLPLRRLDGGWQQVVNEASAANVADLVVRDLYEERGRQSHRETAVDLALHDHRVDDVAAVVDRDEPADLHFAGARVDVDHADVAAERIGEVRWIVVADRLEPGLHALRMIRVRGEGDVLDGLRLPRRALDRELPGLPHQIVVGHLQQIRGDLPRLVTHLARRDRRGGAGDRGRAARVGTEAVGRRVGVAFLDLDVLRRDPELLGQDLRVGGLVALALRLRAEARDGLARRVHADLAAVEHLQTQNVEVLGRARADDLGEARDCRWTGPLPGQPASATERTLPSDISRVKLVAR